MDNLILASQSVTPSAHESSLQELGTYQPAKEKGFLPSYETRLTLKEWNQVYCLFEKAFENDENGQVNFFAAWWRQQAKQATKHYYDLYKSLLKSNTNLLEADKDRIIPKLGRFVSCFETAYDIVKDRARHATVGTDANLQDALFPAVQKTFNTYMRAYEKLKKSLLVS